ncbi:MAG: TolB family protein [Methanosarcina sp.]
MYKKNNFFLLFLAVFILAASCGIGSAYTETRITTNTAEQTNPSIWSNYIVWQDTRNGGSDIYLQDLSTKVQTRVTSNVDAEYPCVSGDKIVWQDKRNGNWDIYMYEISSKETTRITTNTSDQTEPGVYAITLFGPILVMEYLISICKTLLLKSKLGLHQAV